MPSNYETFGEYELVKNLKIIFVSPCLILILPPHM